MLGEQKRAGDNGETDKNNSCAGGQKARWCLAFTLRMITHRHRVLRFDESAAADMTLAYLLPTPGVCI